MGGGVRRWAAIAAVVLAAACSEGSSPSAEPTSSPTASIFLEDRERPKVEQAYEDLVGAIAEEDWATATSLMTDDATEFLADLRVATATAGPKKLRALDTYQLMAVTILRAGVGAEAFGEMSHEELLAHLGRYDLLGEGGRGLDEITAEPVRVFGDRAAVLVPQGNGVAWEIDFELDDGRWKVDFSDLARIGGDSVEGVIRSRDEPLRKTILRAAESVTGTRVTPEIWQKP